ncbi:GNAT family N-acetyltransferase [Streptomyces sp. NPDC101733]|uniref:GNAT family N-acetyltransferase n=1 Tax=unclassified Streptomyces TaxID=2593676 RepID=UPI0038035754
MNATTAPPAGGYGIRCARPGESGAISTLLVRAFADDPVMAWMFPGPSETGRSETGPSNTGPSNTGPSEAEQPARERRMALFFGLSQRQQRPRAGGVRVAASAGGRLLAAALWSGPGRWEPSALRELVALPGYARAFRPGGMRRAAQVQSALHEAHPVAPHWYLPTLGTDPAVQGAGVGSALVREQLARCDRLGEAAYLESSKPANVPFYEGLGFRVTGEIRLPDGGPTLAPMWREPR